MSERIINVPDRIIIRSETKISTIKMEDMPIAEYLKICISMNFYNEEGVI